MNTPEELFNPDGALARTRAARAQMAAALDEDQEPEADEPLGWQAIRKRRRKPKSKAAKKAGTAQTVQVPPGSREAASGRRERASAPLPAEPDRLRRRVPRCPRPVPAAALQRLAAATMPATIR